MLRFIHDLLHFVKHVKLSQAKRMVHLGVYVASSHDLLVEYFQCVQSKSVKLQKLLHIMVALWRSESAWDIYDVIVYGLK